MKLIYRIKLFFLTIFIFFSLCCFSQEFYTSKKWKSSYISEQNKVIFQLDTTNVNYDKATFLAMSIIRENLVANDIEVEAMFYPTDSIIDKNTLCLRFSPLKMVQITKYNGLKSDVYICKRIQIKQINPEVKFKRSISTEVSVAVDNFVDSMETFGIDFSQKLLKHFIVVKPYKEFRFNREDNELNE